MRGRVLAGYLALSFLAFGTHVVAHPQTRTVGGLFTDPQIFVWSLAWWPHAILHGVNPFFTHVLWAPDGFNLAWVTSVPGLALPLAPVTLAFGPIAAYDVACVVLPALNAWTAYLLFRHVTGSTGAALVGGYLFGFSSYVVGGQLSHVNTVAVFLLPLAALAVLRFLDGTLSTRRFVVALAAILAWQATIWTELLFTLTLALAVCLVLAAVLVRDVRPRLRALLPPLAAAYALAATIAAPLFWYVATGTGSRPIAGSQTFVADLANYVVPTRASLFGWWTDGFAARFPTNDVERGAYLGLPALAIVAWFAVERRRSPGARFLLVALAVAVVASLGSWLTVAGHRLATLPWVHVAGLPLMDNAMPVRFSLFASFAAAAIVALWSARGGRLRILLPLLAAVAIVPDVSWSAWARAPDVPALFRSAAWERCIHPGENVLPFPVGPRGDSMVWQAITGFRFRLAGGYTGPVVPDAFRSPPEVVHLTTADNPDEVTPEQVRELARLKGISVLVVDGRTAGPWPRILAPFGPPALVDGALVYRLRGSAPACHAS